ncbi:hypothetical protein FB45DRAFT_1063427 [Roridomyces roridus]|uniref:F-box domain-containing protein n=1 Tax=Roridomyces roridus TaxID=1738132 RepID=A0AAD7FGT2_9AGAR|nr:hypothetical protein FB45DRAFT_1063427 [Roridomyces roridus]
MFLDLPTDLLEEIGKELAPTDQACLRAACRILEGVTQRLFFSRLVLRTGPHLSARRNLDFELLRALTSGMTGWNAHARRIEFVPGPYVRLEPKTKLSFLRLGKEKKRQSREKEAETLFKSALTKMMNVQAILWRPSSRDVPSQRVAIADFVCRLPVLDEFGLDIRCIDLESDAFTLPSVREVRRLELTTFPWGEDTSSRRGHLMANLIRVQNQLTCLHLNSPAKWTEVWVALREARIQLTDITATAVTADLFKYLLSYTGLEKLNFTFQDAGSQEENNRLADGFHESVLLHHADTLVELSCATGYEGRFSFGEHNAHVVAQLHHLNFLAMRVSSTATPRDWGLGMCVDEDSIDVESADIDLPVNLLLDTVAALPRLRHLTIAAADTEDNRYICSHCAENRIRHFRVVQNKAIARVVKDFRRRVASPFEVQVGEEIYGLRPVEGVEEREISQYYLKGRVLLDS